MPLNGGNRSAVNAHISPQRAADTESPNDRRCATCDSAVSPTAQRDRNGLLLCRTHRDEDRRSRKQATDLAWVARRREAIKAGLIPAPPRRRCEPLMTGAKACTKCNVCQPRTNFSIDRTRPDGRAMWCRRCRGAQMAKRTRKYRLAVITHYSHGTMQCACCEERNVLFLTVDHVNNDGAAHRRQLGYQNIFSWLIKNGCPAGFQILCANCNLAKGWYGCCPHGRSHPSLSGSPSKPKTGHTNITARAAESSSPDV